MKGLFEVLVLAAGESTRFGSPKQLAVFKGKPMLMHVVDMLCARGYKPWVAFGANEGEIREQLELGHGLSNKAKIVTVSSWKAGISEAIKSGVSAISADIEGVQGVLVMLADQPLITESDIQRFENAVKQDPKVLACAAYPDGKLGVPAYFPALYFGDLMKLKGDEGARKILRNFPHELVECTDITDIDTRADLERLAEKTT